MNLYVMRHGAAQETSILHPDDYSRPLTREYVNTFRDVSRRMDRMIGDLDRILTSPLLRARETADLVAEGLGRGIRPDVMDVLDGSAAPEVVTNLMAALMGDPSILLVGHSPNIDHLIQYLVAPEELSPITHLNPGDLVRVEFKLPLERKALFHWLIPLEAW